MNATIPVVVSDLRLLPVLNYFGIAATAEDINPVPDIVRAHVGDKRFVLELDGLPNSDGAWQGAGQPRP